MEEICLEVKNITKSYRRAKAVDDVSFEVRRGEILGLVGTNGAGKSTTVSMLATLIKPDSGTILFHGEDVTKNPSSLRRKMGYVPQDIALYESLSGWENLDFWAKAQQLFAERGRAAVKKAAESVGLADEILRKKVREYSGGMKRRLNIAAALLAEPELLILDEPTAGMDIQSRTLILQTIRDLAAQKTAVVYVGHYMEEVEQLCDRVCIMDQGRLVLDETLETALQTENGRLTLEQLYQKLLMNYSA